MTMRHFTASVETAGTPDQVFAFVDDPARTTSYVEGLRRWEPRDGATTHAVGTVIDAALVVGGDTRTAAVRVTEREPGRRIGWEPAEGYPIGGGWSMADAAGGSRTAVTFHLEVDLPGGLTGKLIAKAVEPMVRAVVKRSLDTLAERVAAEY